MDPLGPQTIHFPKRPDTRLGDNSDLRRKVGEEFQGDIQGSGESLEVAVVDAHQVRPRLEGPVQLLPVVDLHKGSQPQIPSLPAEGPEIGIRENPGDEEGPIGPRHAGLQELDRMDDELLPENGNGNGPSNRLEVLEGSTEILPVGEDADSRGTGLLIAGCHLPRVQPRPNGTGTRRSTLYLCHHRHLTAPTECSDQISRERRIGKSRSDLSFRGKECFHLGLFGFHDAMKDARGHTGALRFGQRSGILDSVPVRVSSEGEETMPLTKRQKEILDFITGFIEEQGYAPSFEEIAKAFGYSSLATVHEHLSNLERKGYIRKSYNESRSIETVPEDGTPSALELPLLGAVAAGLPIEAIPDQESLSVPMDMIRPGKDNFVLRVEGNSMIDEQIRDGDYIVVSSQSTASDGEVVVALVGGENATVKKLYREPGDRVRLQPANPAMDSIVLSARDVAVQGVVVGLIRRF